MSPDTTVTTAAHVASHASYMLNKTSALVNFACGMESNDEDRDKELDLGLNRGQGHEWEE